VTIRVFRRAWSIRNASPNLPFEKRPADRKDAANSNQFAARAVGRAKSDRYDIYRQAQRNTHR
jgi:hypothetical protein